MNILFTICARAGSKGVKGKNTKIFCGKPLVNYTLAAYELFCEKYGDRAEHIFLALNTDSELLFEQVNENKIEYIPIKRDDSLAGDFVGKMDVIRDTLVKCEEQKDMQFDVIIDLDLTSPLRTVADVEGTLNVLLANPQADISYSVTHARRLPDFNMVRKNENGFYEQVIKSNYVSRQQAPDYYDMNASIYAYRRAYLLNGPSSEEVKELIWKMKDTGVLDIDSEEDFELMQIIAEYFFDKKDGYREIYKFLNHHL